MKHIHADLMKLYWEDAEKSETPWENWECKLLNGESSRWHAMDCSPSWDKKMLYRRKIKTIFIGDIEIPAPETVAPPKHSTYYFPCLTAEGSDWYSWNGSELDKYILRNGLLHLNRENATEHSKAFLKLTSRGISQEVKVVKKAIKKPTASAKWLPNTGSIPKERVAKVKFRSGAVLDDPFLRKNYETYDWTIEGDDRDITHYQLAVKVKPKKKLPPQG